MSKVMVIKPEDIKTTIKNKKTVKFMKAKKL